MGNLANKIDSDALYRLRGIAIMTVIAAHCIYKNESLQVLTDIIGTIGVPIFLVLNGFFINMNQDVGDFIKNKTKKSLCHGLCGRLLPTFY